MRQSAGMMVNYVYRLEEVEANHEAYARDRTIVASRRLEQRARESLMSRGSAARERDAAPEGDGRSART
jgi:malonyl-CoA decarboxylase